MTNRKAPLSTQARVMHRYLGFFLAGIMAVYALSGIVMIFRDTDFLKKEVVSEKQLDPNLSGGEISPKLKLGGKLKKEEGGVLYFENGTYNTVTGMATIRKMELPFILDKMERLHKAKTSSPLYFLNIIFGSALLFFVFSAFWMYTPKTTIFKKGMYFAFAGIVLTLVLLFL